MVEAYKILKNLVKNVEIFLVYIQKDKQAASKFLKNRDIIFESLEIPKAQLLSEVTKQKLSKLIKQFKNLSEIEALRKVDRYKYVGRNMLGIRKFDDWINNLEIGNIMHLNPITTSELT